MNRQYVTAVFLLCLLKPIVVLAQTSEPTSELDLNTRCEILEDLYLKDTNILSAAIVPAAGDFPEYCRVLGYIRPAINFEIRLPVKNWNNKFYMHGCGGLCGTVNTEATDKALKRNYAVSTMDSGHWGSSIFSDGSWGYNNRAAEIDFAYRAVHETALVTKKGIEAFYDQEANQSYFEGCSTAGRQAVMEAWKYPEDFDGIICIAPALDLSGIILNYAWLLQSNTGRDGKDRITPADLALISRVVYDVCDEVDGLKDGLIEAPGNCQFDPTILLCSENKTSDCLTAEQVETLKAWYGGVKNSAGERLYPGAMPLGSEPFWEFWITGETDMGNDGAAFLVAREFLRYLVFEEDPGDAYSFADFDFDKDPQRMEFMAQIYNADNPDLAAFRERGGKLLMIHGWADAMIPPWKTTEYYEAVERNVGSRETTQEFSRLFMIPGMDHCGILDGPGIQYFAERDGFDLLTALEKWVEMDEPPESILTTKYDDDGNVLWTRPVCPYPQRAIYKGSGDINDATNYSCGDPQ